MARAVCSSPLKTCSTLPWVCEMLESTIQLEALPKGFLRMEQHDPVLELPPCLPLSPDPYFCDEGARIDFHRGKDGQVEGLTMHATRYPFV